MPLAGTRMFHPRFQEHHRPVAERQMIDECVISRPSSEPTAWDDAAGKHTYPDPVQVYAGACRIQHATLRSSRSSAVVADRSTSIADYRVVIPADAPVVQINDIVTMTVSIENTDLVGETLTVGAMTTGSVTWQRDLTCQMQPRTTR